MPLPNWNVGQANQTADQMILQSLGMPYANAGRMPVPGGLPPTAAIQAQPQVPGLLATLQRDPSISLALLQAGSRLLQGRQPGQTRGGVIGDAFSTGANTFVADKDRRLRNDYLKQNMDLAKRQDTRADKQDTRAERGAVLEEQRARREAAEHPVRLAGARLDLVSKKLGNELQVKYGDRIQAAVLKEHEARTGLIGAQSTYYKERDRMGGKNAPSGQMQMIANLAGIYKADAIRSGRTVADEEVLGQATKDYYALEAASKTPEEFELNYFNSMLGLIDPEDKKQVAQLSKLAKEAATTYRSAIPDITKRGQTLGTVPPAAASAAPAPAAPAPGTSPEAGGVSGTISRPGSTSAGQAYWDRLMADPQHANATDAQLNSWVSSINKYYSDWTPPADVMARLQRA